MTLTLRLLGLALLLLVPTGALAQGTADIQLLAWSMNGELALIEEGAQHPDGGRVLSFRVVGPGVMQKRYEVLNDLLLADGVKRRPISEADCRKTLQELKTLLVEKRFKGVTLHGDACEGERGGAITIGEEAARAADASELETSSTSDALVKGDWTLRFAEDRVVLTGPKGSKRLRLPRPIAPSSAHVLLSPSRKLLLIYVSSGSGDQRLAAGFSSKSGEIADFE